MDKKTETPFHRTRSNVRRATKGIRSGASTIGARAKAARVEAEKGVDRANQIITEHPLAAAAAAVVVGALAAYLFPKTSRALRKAAPKVVNAAVSAGREARDLAKSKLPVEEAGQAIEQLSEAARKANAATADMAKAGLDHARAVAVEAARRTEIEAHAQKLLDAASEAASKIIGKVRNRGSDDTSGPES